jgi:hypothetical protein
VVKCLPSKGKVLSSNLSTSKINKVKNNFRDYSNIPRKRTGRKLVKQACLYFLQTLVLKFPIVNTLWGKSTINFTLKPSITMKLTKLWCWHGLVLLHSHSQSPQSSGSEGSSHSICCQSRCGHIGSQYHGYLRSSTEPGWEAHSVPTSCNNARVIRPFWPLRIPAPGAGILSAGFISHFPGLEALPPPCEWGRAAQLWIIVIFCLSCLNCKPFSSPLKLLLHWAPWMDRRCIFKLSCYQSGGKASPAASGDSRLMGKLRDALIR